MKLIITESQFDRVKPFLTEEGTGKYSTEVTLRFYPYNAKLKGYEVGLIEDVKVSLRFDIHIEAKSWGIKSIDVTNITGPKEVEAEVEYYDQNGEPVTIQVPIPINWDAAVINSENSSLITIDNDVDVYVTSDSDGNLIVKTLEMTIYQI